jgi:membrane protease YdiL (CAAX protease family)
MIQTTWNVILVGTPFVFGSSPLEWVHQEFPTPVPWRDIAVAIVIMLLPIWIMYGIWITAGWVRIEPPHDKATRRRKLIRFIGPWPLATLEEAVFRGVLLEQVLRTFPDSWEYTALSIVGTSMVFSSIHFISGPMLAGGFGSRRSACSSSVACSDWRTWSAGAACGCRLPCMGRRSSESRCCGFTWFTGGRLGCLAMQNFRKADFSAACSSWGQPSLRCC